MIFDIFNVLICNPNIFIHYILDLCAVTTGTAHQYHIIIYTYVFFHVDIEPFRSKRRVKLYYGYKNKNLVLREKN